MAECRHPFFCHRSHHSLTGFPFACGAFICTLAEIFNAMNKLLITLFVLVLTAGCKEKSGHEEHSHHDPDGQDETEISGNALLNNEVMKIHDEVMPKLEDIHNRTQELKKQLTDNPNMEAEEKERIEAKIARLDSASEGMMDWMHGYNPIPDSEGEEKARAYLENEMEKIKKVRADILSALEEADKN